MDQFPKTKLQSHILAGDGGSTQPGISSNGGKMPTICGKTDSGLPETLSEKQLHLDLTTPLVPALPTLIPASIEAAEGYLELVTRPAVRLGADRRMRVAFARKALKLAVISNSCLAEPKHEARRQMVIGQSHRILRRYRAATSAFRQVAKYRPLRVEALMAMGWCQKRSGRVDLAVVSLTRALSIVPEDPRLHYNLACYLAASGQCRAAIYELAWALELEPLLQKRALSEQDFDALRLFPAFCALTSSRILAK